MWGAIAVNLAILGISYAYHRHEQKSLKNKTAAPRPAREVSVPRTDDGAPIPLLYGRCRVREPWLAWTGTPSATAFDPEAVTDYSAGAPFYYQMNMFFVVGIPFANGVNQIRNVWVDDMKLATSLGPLSPPNDQHILENGTPGTRSEGYIGDSIAFYDGADDQLFCNETSPFAPITAAGVEMEAKEGTGATVPSFQRYLSAFLYSDIGGWYIGNEPRPGAYSFEALSFPEGNGLAGNRKVGEEANPADVLLDLLSGVFGKLGIPLAYIDLPSFRAAAVTLLAENHGFSRSFEGGASGEEYASEVLEQVDGVLRENPSTDKVELKLIRPDFDLGDVFALTPSNCELEDYQPGNWDNVINKVRVVFRDRELNYQDNSATAFNEANARSQIGSPDELVLQMPGVCTLALAQTIAERELSFRSRPIATCRVRVNRSAVRKSVGDVVSLTWPEYGISGLLFRISKADKGAPGDEKITLHLMQEVYFARRGELDWPSVPGAPAHR